jgi:L-ascorbate metabolism protein UlaG (beta-lactamase superfamily)
MHIAILVLLFIALIILIAVMAGVMISGPKYRGPRSDHFDGSRFINPENVKAKGGMEVFKWMMNRKPGPWKENTMAEFGKRPLGHFSDGIRVTFVNHSTFLIQVDGMNILTDPVWSKRVSPYRWIGPKRMRPPGIRMGDLPRIHLVLLTHNHYDHLDIETMRVIFGAHHPQIVTPLGVKKFLDENYIPDARQVDWWEEVEAGKVKIQAVPAQHFSGRGMFDRDATLWCGYVIRTSAGNIYFAGDTGYNEGTFKEIGSKCAPLKLSFVPIGAYKPGWFMSPIHVSPEEAVKIHQDVGSPRSIAMHFGTFPLADDGSDDPVTDLRLAAEKYKITDESFLVLKEGEAVVFE